MRWYNTLVPYKELTYNGIQYGVCYDYDHISRYKGLRSVVHNPNESDRFIAPETVNTFRSNVPVTYYVVTSTEENRLDLIANKFLGSATYSWVLAYFNHITDGYTVHEGQRIMIPKSFTSLFNDNEVLASIPPLMLNLGSE
jgi:hypothetical protein